MQAVLVELYQDLSHPDLRYPNEVPFFAQLNWCEVSDIKNGEILQQTWTYSLKINRAVRKLDAS